MKVKIHFQDSNNENTLLTHSLLMTTKICERRNIKRNKGTIMLSIGRGVVLKVNVLG
jgi:hypothetical protein